MKDQEIITLSDREHILQKSQMYVGSLDEISSNEFILKDEKIQREDIKYIPALLKIINEAIDNSVDEAIKTNFEYGNKIKIDIDSESVSVQDNGRGIPVKTNEEGHYYPVMAFCNARTGSNFGNQNSQSIGTHGLGIKATNIFSSRFEAETCDGENRLNLVCLDNMSSDDFSVRKKSGRYTHVKFWPDLKRFNLKEIDQTHINLIKQRIVFLSVSFPQIKFYFNGEKINVSNTKNFLSLFSDDFEIISGKNWFIGVLPNDEDDFSFFTYVNGLYIKNGGNHISLISNEIISRIREKLVKKYKTIKPGDIRNKLSVVVFFQGFSNMKFDSQTKETLTNSTSEIREYLGLSTENWDSFGKVILRNTNLIDPILEMFKLKEEFKKRQELKKISGGKKKIVSDKYYAPVGEKKYLILSEGDSACGSMIDILGRRDKAYFALKGKPLNTFDRKTMQIIANKEIQSIVDILGLDLTDKDTDMDFEKVILLSDQDSDGFHIRSLLLTFFNKFTPRMIKEGRIQFMDTPLLIASKKGKPVKWFYSLEDYQNFIKQDSTKYDWKYLKGLGSLQKSDMKIILEGEGGFENLLTSYKFTDDSSSIMEKWMSNKCSDERKEMLRGKQFNVNVI